MSISKLASVCVLFTTAISTTAMTFDADAFGIKSEKRIPASVAKKRNPYPPGPHSLEVGQSIYYDECRQCHGKNGLGDGDEGTDLTAESVRSMSDGELFWQIRTGVGPMPSYRKTLSKEDTWHVINYLRSVF